MIGRELQYAAAWAKKHMSRIQTWREILQPVGPCRTGAPYLDASRLSSTSMITYQISTRSERGTGRMLIQQGLVQQTSAAVFWHRLLSAFLLLSLESEEMLLESEEMEDMESDGEGFCSSEREKKKFNSRRDIWFFAVAVHDIAESRVTSTIGTCNSMRVWGARTLDTGTYGRNIGHTYSGESDGDRRDRRHWAYFEIDLGLRRR